MIAADEAEDEAGYLALTARISRERGFSCASYKDRCVRRRIAVRMRACRVASYAEYSRYLDANPGEWDRLLDALTINVTKFFRNGEVYDLLSTTVVPALWGRPDPTLRVWSAGCASGEEPYSLAILFHEHAVRLGSAADVARVQVVGSDVDVRSLAVAEKAAYSEPSFTETSRERRARYFSSGDPAVVRADVRAMVHFEQRDLLRDGPPRGPLHLIVCRNVMIYFDRETQDRLVVEFRDALAPGGYLVLGQTETLLGPVRQMFNLVATRERVYQRP